MTEKDTFWETAERCKKVVATWPLWKRRIVISAETIKTGKYINEDEPMNAKQKLVEELRELDKKTGYWHGGTDYGILANYILARDAKNLGPLVKLERTEGKFIVSCADDVDNAIDQTLTNFGVEIGEMK